MDSKLGGSFSQSGPAAVPIIRFNNKHATFEQKQLLFNFMEDHKQLAMHGHDDDALWNELTNLLNGVAGGAVRPTEYWQRSWKLWVTNVQKRQNDMSLTLLDTRLQSFLVSIEHAENLKAMIQDFIEFNENTLESEQICTAVKEIPQMLNDEILRNLVLKLKDIESNETSGESLTKAHAVRLSELLNMRDELEKEANTIVADLEEKENLILQLRNDKIETLNAIRKHLSLRQI